MWAAVRALRYGPISGVLFGSGGSRVLARLFRIAALVAQVMDTKHRGGDYKSPI